MKHLTEIYWNNFKVDGKLFEQLSKKLIEFEFHSNDFIIVGGKGDNGRDIDKEIELLNGYKTSIWAQCKYHKKSLSFSDISYTLLMAILRNTNQVLIFSYSNVTDDFEEKLKDYLRRTGKDVILYADEALEKLILKHKDSFDNLDTIFFDNWPSSADSINKKDVTCEVDLYIDNHKIKKHQAKININTICELNYILTNNSEKPINISLSVVKNQIYKRFTFLNSSEQNEITIAPGAMSSFSVFIRLNKNLKTTSLPVFLLEYNGITEKVYTSKRLNYLWLAETQLIGKKYKKIHTEINEIINSKYFQIAFIHGSSGTGKSRLLKEAITLSYFNSARPIYIDTEKKQMSCNVFLKLLCSEIMDMPVFDNLNDLFHYNGSEKAMAYSAKILYDSSYDLNNEWEKTAEFFVYMLSQEKIVLILDNIQHLDDMALKIIERVVLLLKNSKSYSSLLFGINTDYIYSNTYIDCFFKTLISNSSNEPTVYHDFFVDGFSNKEAELYIRECISFSYDPYKKEEAFYEETIKEIAEHCNNNPFFIQQFLLYLEQKDILRRTDNTIYYFHDIETYKKSYFKIPRSINTLIKSRIALLMDILSDEQKSKFEELIFLINLTKVLPISIYYKIIKNRTLLSLLQDLGFIVVTQDDNIVYYHSFFKIHFDNEYKIDGINDELCRRFIVSIDNLGIREDLVFPYFWSKYHLNTYLLDDILEAIKKLINWDTDYLQFHFCFKPISISLEKYRSDFDSHTYILVYKTICENLEQISGIDSAGYYYKKVLNNFINYTEDYKDVFLETCEFLRSYLISLINLENYNECNKTIEKLDEFNGFQNKENSILNLFKNQCKIMIYNRTNLTEDAVKLSNENLAILNDSEFNKDVKKKYIYSAKRSIGNSYFYSTKAYEKRNEIVQSWDDSYNSYIDEFGIEINCNYSNQTKLAVYSKGLAADIISEREKDADNKSIYLSNALDKMQTPYYEMQIRLLLSIFYIWKWSDSIQYKTKLNGILKLINQSIDIATIYGRKLTVINGYYLKGIAHLINRDYSLALDNYCITADFLYEYIHNSDDYFRWNYFWTDFAVLCRKTNTIKINMNQINNLELRESLKSITKMDDDSFEDYINHYMPMSAITDKNHSISFPKI